MMLTNEQIKYLESYCTLNGVHYYDLQLEVIDHIAGMIEDLQQQDPTLDFKTALHQVNAAFTKNDFIAIVKNKKQQLQKKVSKLIEKEFISFFTVPRVILTVLLFAAACSIPAVIKVNEAAGIAGIVFIISPLFYYLIRYSKEIKSLEADRKANLLCLRVRSKYEKIVFAFLACFYLLVTGFRELIQPHFFKTGIAAMFIMLLLVTVELFYIAILHVRFSFNVSMKNLYPNAFANN